MVLLIGVGDFFIDAPPFRMANGRVPAEPVGGGRGAGVEVVVAQPGEPLWPAACRPVPAVSGCPVAT